MSDESVKDPGAPEVVEVPQQDAEGSAAIKGEQDTQEASKDASGAPEAAQGATVVNDADGQHVQMPDGSVVFTRSHPYPVSNHEWENYELTHSGDQERYSLRPGDRDYSPYSDPSVPNSHLAQMVEREIQGYGERVQSDPQTKVSAMWEGLQPVYRGQLANAIATGGGDSEVEA
jgi:hypothetical protein